MVARPSDYLWSSYRCNAEGKKDALITFQYKYLELGKNDDERQIHYRALFQEPLPEKRLNDIREATNKAWVLGDEYFKKKIKALTDRRVEKLSRGRPKCSTAYNKNRV